MSMQARASSLVREVTTTHVGTAAPGCPVERELDSFGLNFSIRATARSLAPLDSRGRLSPRGS